MKFKHIATRKEENIITFLMKQGEMHFLLTAPLDKESAISTHLQNYGDSVKKISLWVTDVQACFEGATTYGAKVVLSPQQKLAVLTASIEIFNEVEHEFLQINASNKIPGFDYDDFVEEQPMLLYFDHIALCHPANTIAKWVKFYKEVFSFTENTNEDIYSEESGMHIIIMKSPNGKINFPLVEPTSEKSPLATYLKYNQGAGVHHIAFGTNNIIAAVKYYEQHFGELRKAQPQYYEDLLKTNPDLRQKISKISPHGILLEQDSKGILFQIFTKPVVTRPTLFLEFIERDVCEGFGTVNIKALYDTLET